MESNKKAPGVKMDYGFEWDDWLEDGDTIIASEGTVETGLTKVSDSFTVTTTTIWIEGGTLGVDYTLMNQITTAQDRDPKRSIIIYVRER